MRLGSENDVVQRFKETTLLLTQINILPKHMLTKQLERIYAKDEIAGPLEAAHMFRQMKQICPAHEEVFGTGK